METERIPPTASSELMGGKEKADFGSQGHILILTGCYLPVVGGVVKIIHEMSQKFVDLGYTVDILTCSSIHEVQHDVLDGCNIYRLSSWELVDGNYPVPTFNRKNISLLLNLAKNDYLCIITNTRFYLYASSDGSYRNSLGRPYSLRAWFMPYRV